MIETSHSPLHSLTRFLEVNNLNTLLLTQPRISSWRPGTSYMTVTSFIIGLISNAMSALNLTPGLAAAEPFQDPTVEDVFLVKAIFKAATPLPLEIVDTIIDHAEYWPRTTSFIQPALSARGSTPKEDVFIVCSCSQPLPSSRVSSPSRALLLTSCPTDPHPTPRLPPRRSIWKIQHNS